MRAHFSGDLMIYLGALLVWSIMLRQVVECIEALIEGRWMMAAWLAFCAFGSLVTGLAVWRAA